jgi:HEAT repeat protein
MTMTLSDDIELLSHSRSPKRRTAAKRLRKLADATAGPALVVALENELNDERTWETQYQMVMAIGHCNYTDALPFVESLVVRRLGGMVDIAIGDTLLRLSRQHENDAARAIEFIDAENQLLTHGAMQAIAMLRMLPGDTTMKRLIDHGLSLNLGEDDWTVIWLLRAVPGWPGQLVSQLLNKWGAVPFLQQQQIHGAVDLARKNKYYKWSPL